ncbi:hypothetical protein K523DRAFT_323761, partial [Schizophyllum commune Tattone D]
MRPECVFYYSTTPPSPHPSSMPARLDEQPGLRSKAGRRDETASGGRWEAGPRATTPLPLFASWCCHPQTFQQAATDPSSFVASWLLC